MSIELEMMRLQNRAKRDADVRNALLETRNEEDPYKAFCDTAQKLGYDITLFELADMGQAFCDAMMRSVNGGGRDNFEIWTDFYEMFFDAIK
ncbi:MAG: hypothetical protein IIX21_05210 [Clostridia bacterium]|nr:hypothetical protein [Clostridia bacterium]